MNPASPAGWTVTVSIGVHAVIPTRNQSPASALMATDTLLYMAKKRGPNLVLSDKDAAVAPPPGHHLKKEERSQSDRTLILPRLNVAG